MPDWQVSGSGKPCMDSDCSLLFLFKNGQSTNSAHRLYARDTERNDSSCVPSKALLHNIIRVLIWLAC